MTDNTRPNTQGEAIMTNIDQDKWARAKSGTLARVSEAFDLMVHTAEVGEAWGVEFVHTAEVGEAWGVEFVGKLSLVDANLDASIPIGYRTDVFADDRLPEDDGAEDD